MTIQRMVAIVFGIAAAAYLLLETMGIILIVLTLSRGGFATADDVMRHLPSSDGLLYAAIAYLLWTCPPVIIIGPEGK